jgi:CubicO group peptidase (beta-lactamase class C family)
MPKEGWLDHAAMRRAVCDFALEWTPGSKVVYHGLSAHWVMAAVMEAVTGRDFREVVRDNVLTPLGLAGEITVGLRPADDARAADMHEPVAGGGVRVLADTDNDTWKRAGAPGGGGYGTARGMVALYQMMLAGGTLGGARVLSPRTIQFALRNRTGDRVDEYMGMPMHRALGPHLRGLTNNVRGMGALAAPETFGHGGVGSSYCWADPTSGVSFAYITNCRIPDPWVAADPSCPFVANLRSSSSSTWRRAAHSLSGHSASASSAGQGCRHTTLNCSAMPPTSPCAACGLQAMVATNASTRNCRPCRSNSIRWTN